MIQKVLNHFLSNQVFYWIRLNINESKELQNDMSIAAGRNAVKKNL